MKNRKLKVVTVVGTRPEIIRLSETIKILDRHTDHVLVHTGQNYDFELNKIFFTDLGIRKPDYFLGAAGKNSSETVANTLVKVDEVLEQVNPDSFLVLGDTNSCLAAYAAKRRKIPVFHMEAGNRSFDERVPEEINRRIIDHISDINLVYSDLARQNLIREGFPLDRIIKTGSPMFEVLTKNSKKIESSKILKKLSLKQQEYFVLSIHREENVENEQHLSQIVDFINAVAQRFRKPIIMSVHPRTRNKIDESRIVLSKEVRLLKPLGFLDYINLQKNALCVFSDSGTISEESSILNFPALNVREAHERPEAMDEGAVIMTGLSVERLLQALELVLKQARGKKRDFYAPKDYGYDNVSQKVLRVIVSYVDYVKKRVWLER